MSRRQRRHSSWIEDVLEAIFENVWLILALLWIFGSPKIGCFRIQGEVHEAGTVTSPGEPRLREAK